MKHLLHALLVLFITVLSAQAQTGRQVQGTVIDSTKTSLPGSTVLLTSDQKDSITTSTDANGRFVFPSVKGTKVALTIKSLGYESIKRRYTLENNNQTAILDPIILKAESHMLNQVNITSVIPVTVKEDTVEYKASAYKVREGAPVEDVLKKLPGVDVDMTTGAVTAQGQSVTKVRLNGKDYMGGDVTSLTKNLPADIVDNIQVVDDYGDQANLTGIKTGTPNKVLNINIRKDKNYGYFLQATGGDGEDLLPKDQGQTDANRYVGLLNSFEFHGDRQISLLGGINNTNVNTFNFGSTGGGGNFGGGGGGGRGNAARGGGGNQTTNQNGITNARSIGTNFRDQWGKHLSVYGSYSFADNSTYTNSISQQKIVNPTNPSNPNLYNQGSQEHDENINHRFNFNFEYKPDTVNYLKVTPNITYSRSFTNEADSVLSIRNGSINSRYTSTSYANSSSPNYGLTALYNHRFKHRRNLSITGTASSSTNNQYQNPLYNYIAGLQTVPINQQITTNSRTTSFGTNFSYLEPLGKISYLELNYAFNHSYTTSEKITDTLANTGSFLNYPLFSNNYNFTFITNRIGLNYRVIGQKYNYTIGLGVLPTVLDGNRPSNPEGEQNTHISAFYFSPNARYVYNFSRSNTLSISYNGSSNQPSFNQLQPVIDLSNATYPVQGNPDLKPSYTNTFSIRYNKFSFQTGNIFFSSFNFTQTNNNVVTNTITEPEKFAAAAIARDTTLKRLGNTYLTQYLNANGFYSLSGNVVYGKPFADRKYNLYLTANASYNNNVGFVSRADSNNVITSMQKNIAKTLSFTPGARFRVDITDVIDAQVLGSYSINRTNNSVNTDFTQGNSNVRTLTLGVNGKNYFFKDWTFSYDFSRNVNYGYTIPVTNPNILNVYVERRFLKNHAATIRLAAFDLFNQNSGFSYSATSSSTTESHINRLGRYFLATFTLRLQKFAGRSPIQNPDGRGQGRRFRDGGGSGGPGGAGGPQ